MIRSSGVEENGKEKTPIDKGLMKANQMGK
jgi:hypothetical protein